MLPSNIFLEDFFGEESSRRDPFMKCDIYEEENKTLIEIDMPGAKKENLNLDIEEGYLTISYKNEESDSENRKYIRRERKCIKSCSRRFYVGNIDDSEIKAEFKDGILKISIPQEAKELSKKTINID